MRSQSFVKFFYDSVVNVVAFLIRLRTANGGGTSLHRTTEKGASTACVLFSRGRRFVNIASASASSFGGTANSDKTRSLNFSKTELTF